ncbi:unnamed protein product [Musa textilis]
MKKAGAYAASLAAASAATLTALNNPDHGASSSPSSKGESPGWILQQGSGSSIDKDAAGSVVADKFAPRFDGLRFIETLVTAHR